MIHVVAVITAHPGQRQAVLDALIENVGLVRAEAGCVAYEPVVDAADAGPFQARLGDDAFMVLEAWETLDALKAHGAAPHMVAFGKRTKGMVAHRAIHVLRAASPSAA